MSRGTWYFKRGHFVTLAEVFKFGTVFSGRVFNSERAEEVGQSLTPGNADDLFDGDALRVDLAGLDTKIGRARLRLDV